MTPTDVTTLAVALVCAASVVAIAAFWAGYNLGCRAGLMVGRAAIQAEREKHAATLALKDALTNPAGRSS